MIVTELRRVATAFTFMTRLPLVARWSFGDAEELAKSTRYFPLVGYVVGFAGYGAMYAAGEVLPRAIAAAIGLVAMVLVTGCFHEDGLADTADGFGGAFDPARKLEIMKDSRIGTYGSTALILSLLIRWQLLVEMPTELLILAIPSAHVLGRWSSGLLSLMLPYVREGASNKPVADGMGKIEFLIGSAFVALWLIPFPLPHAVAILVTVLVACVAAAGFRRQIGGTTGDTLGAANQLVEIAVMMSWLIGARAGLWWDVGGV